MKDNRKKKKILQYLLPFSNNNMLMTGPGYLVKDNLLWVNVN